MGTSGSGSSSPFRIGESVELWRVIAHLSSLVIFIMLFERLLHYLQHKMSASTTYREIVTKVFGEFMIPGFIGLFIKLMKELIGLDPYSPEMVAFQAADLVVFLLAMALVLQSVCVFVALRNKNILAEKAELISSSDLCAAVERFNADSPRTSRANLFVETFFTGFKLKIKTRGSRNKVAFVSRDYTQLMQSRLLRHFFLKRNGLPELFPFSKYLRQAQNNQITHMIKVEMSTWIILLTIAWSLEGLAGTIYRTTDRDEKFASVLAFQIFTWVSVVLHVLALMYLRKKVAQLLGSSANGSGYLATLKETAVKERLTTTDYKSTADAIECMKHIRDQERTRSSLPQWNFIAKRDTGFQLISIACRYFWTLCTATDSEAQVYRGVPCGDSELGNETSAGQQLRGFSRKLWHFLVMSLLMINGFFVGLFFQCILYQCGDIKREFGSAIVVATTLPLFLNVFVLQPPILHSFILISSVMRVDHSAMANVIDHFIETLRLGTEFVASVSKNLQQSKRSVGDLMHEFTKIDVLQTGYVDMNAARVVLRDYGFQVSYFRFSSVAKLLFPLKGAQLQYSELELLLHNSPTELLMMDEVNGDEHAVELRAAVCL